MAESTQTNSTVVGYFSSHEQADRALHALVNAGFNRGQISIAGHSREKGFTVEDQRRSGAVDESHESFWQKVKHFFEGDTSSDTGSRSAAGKQDFSRDTTYDYDYDSSDFYQSLRGLSLPEEQSRYFSDRFSRDPDSVLLIVDASSRSAQAAQILEQNGGDVGQKMSSWKYDQTRQTTGTSPELQRMQLYGEVLRTHRDRVQRGEARLRKETVTENQRVDVPVTREELVVERAPVSGEKAAPDARIGQNSEVRVPLSEERVSVNKEPVVREEVRVGKKGVTNVESHDETLRREELKVNEETKKKAG